MITILQGDVVEQLKTLPDKSVHCTVTSPPYDNLRTYKDSPTFDLKATIKELYRVLIDGGVIVWVVGDQVINGSESGNSFRQALAFMGSGFNLHDTMIYGKNNSQFPEFTRYHQQFEYTFIFSKGPIKTFNPIKDRKNISVGQSCFGIPTHRQEDGSLSVDSKKRITENEFGMRGNIWIGNTRAQEAPCQELLHPAMMPTWLARDHIISWSNIGDTVLDPFMGSGTTLEEARLLKRNAIGIEINPDYIKDARRYLRLNEQLGV